MPHKHKIRRNKAVKMLITRDNVINVPREFFVSDRENMVPRLTEDAMQEARTMICDRYTSARQTTEAMAIKMDKWDKQYLAEWDGKIADDEKIYLPKTREQVQVIKAYILNLVSQLDPLVTMQPMVSSIWASNEEYRRAKVAEALLDFHMDDLWKIRDDVFPEWLTHFLKYSMAVWEITYREDDNQPDLNITVADRALLYFDPFAKTIKKAGWVIKKYFLPRSEVMQRIDDGHWSLPETDHHFIEEGFHNQPEEIKRRYLGKDYKVNTFSMPEDELVEIWDYWQAPRQGRSDVYAVILGGENGRLVRYGRNPFPYKGIPFVSKSFDPHEFRPDGTGAVEQFTPFQELINNFLNMRITDVRKNIIRSVAVTGKFIDAQTQEDFKNGNKFVRLSDEVLEAANDPNFDVNKHFAELPGGTSTQELLVQDLPFILGQGKESSQVSDVFRGQNPQPGATLGQIQEQLSRNQGVFRPIYLQVMRGFEELAEVAFMYFKSEDFFPKEKIIRVIGQNKYAKEIGEWHNPGGNVFVRAVNPDEMEVDVTIDAVNAADALASKTFLINSLEKIFQSIGQIPELFTELKKKLDFVKMAELMINSSGQDIEGLRLNPQEREKREQEAAQTGQQALQQQQQMQQMASELQTAQAKILETDKQNARADAQIEIDQNKASLDSSAKSAQLTQESQELIRKIAFEVQENLRADLVRMTREAALESVSEDLSVGHGNNVNQ